MKERGVITLLFLILIAVVLSSSFVLASITLGNQSSFVYTSYGPGESINGWVNLSVADESTDLKLQDNKGNSITLLEWLKDSSSIDDYSCMPNSCNPVYTHLGTGVDSMSLDLIAGETKYVGFKFDNPSDPLDSIINFSFSIDSNAGASCENQLEIQLMDNPSLILKNKNSTSTRCSHLKSYGCFNSSKITTTGYISGTSKFCQKVYLYDSPGFYLGTWLDRKANAKETKIGVYTLAMDLKANCSLPGTTTIGEAEYSCPIDVWNGFTPGNYYVCVYSSSSGGDINTSIKFYNDNVTGCGFSSTAGIANENKAYQIYAQGKEFVPFGSVSIGDKTHTTTSLKDEIKRYIDDIYGGVCNSCIVPVKLTAMQSQRVTITPTNIRYSAAGVGYSVTSVHNISMQGAKVSTIGYNKLSLNNLSFNLPTTFGTFNYDLTLGTKEILKKEVLTIERVPLIKSVYPSETVHSFPVKLTVKVETANNASIVSYLWKIKNFTRTTTTNVLQDFIFPYPGGPFDVEVTVTDENQKTASKTFLVTAISPSTYIGEKIKSMKVNLENITNTVSKMPIFEQNTVKSAINLTYLGTKLQEIESLQVDLEGSQTKNYTRIVSEITSLRIPSLIEENLIATTLSFYPKRETVNLEALENFHGGSHESSETNEYIDAIVYSYSENINGKISKKEINALYDGGDEAIASIYELKLTSRFSSLAGQNLIMKEMGGLTFKAPYNEKRESGYVSIPLDGKEKIITFSTTDDIDYFDLPLFVSPSLEELVIIGAIEEAADPGIKWALFILIIFFLLLAGFVVYLILQYWYKTKYETYLFKERNYLYNLINYINESNKKGLSDKEIWKKLRQKNWTREQITYVMNKYVGKRTGMLEIPVDKLLNKIFGSKISTTQQVLSKPGVIMPASPGQPTGMPPRKPFSRGPTPSNAGPEFGNPQGQPGNSTNK